MTDERQLDQFGDAVERKKAASKAASEQTQADHPNSGDVEAGEQPEAKTDHAHTQDERDIRAKNSRHKQVTADKWNQ
jgi:hypothetical protein